MAWRGHEASPPASPPRAGYEQPGRPAEGPPRGYEAGGHDGLDDLDDPMKHALAHGTRLRVRMRGTRTRVAFVVRERVAQLGARHTHVRRLGRPLVDAVEVEMVVARIHDAAPLDDVEADAALHREHSELAR